MDKSLQETLNRVRSYLANKEFNEGLTVLENLPEDLPEVKHMCSELEQAKLKEIDLILKEVEKAQIRKDWQAAFDFIRRAQNLDSRDNKVRSAAEQVRNAFVTEKHTEESGTLKQRARSLLNRTGKTIQDIEAAIRLLEEVITRVPGDLDGESLLTEAQQVRSEFLKIKGQIATLELAEKFEEALNEIKNLIVRGFIELDGENIFYVQSQLEKKAREFADQKAAKYLKKAEDALRENNNPQLAMRYIDMGLSLPVISKLHRDAFNELKLEVEIAHDKFKEVDQQVKEACSLMDQQVYEKAIFKLEESLEKIPGHFEAQTFLKLARDGLRERILKDARMFIARIENGSNKSNFQKLQKDLLNIMDQLNVLGDKSGDMQKKSTSVSSIEESKTISQIFISYSHRDKEFVNRLASDLEKAGTCVWLDEKKIKVGDSISKKIEDGISKCDFFCLVISKHSFNSNWVEREYRTALNAQLSSGTTPKILPLLIQNIEIPLLLKDIKYADFSGGYNRGLNDLFNAVKKQ
jgi:tetratricopeptide (TPR) repeat protein